MDTNVPALTWDPGKFLFQRKLGNFVQYFQVNLPTNSYGIPLKIINPLLIAENMLDCETTDDMPDHIVQQAVMDIDFEDGLPIVEGTPIWERFDGEPVDYYKLFKEYREMVYNMGSRSISKLSATHNIIGKNLNALAKVYHWQLRCKAYDVYKQQEFNRRRQFEIEKLESKHARVAEKLLEQSMAYLEDHPEQLNPKIALQMLQTAMKAGRLALGLNADKPGSGDSGPSININQTTRTDMGEVTSSVSVGNSESVKGAEDVSYLQSILHILDKSGAFDRHQDVIIDADYEAVDDDASDAEGA